MRSPRVRRTIIVVSLAVMVACIGAAFVGRGQRPDKAAAHRQEALLRELIKDEPLANMSLQPARDGPAGLLALVGIDGPRRRRGERALMSINPIDPKKGLTRATGPTIDACRAVPDGVPAELRLLRPVPVADQRGVLGPYSSRSKGDAFRFKDVDFFTYGDLDVGVKDGAIVVIRVR